MKVRRSCLQWDRIQDSIQGDLESAELWDVIELREHKGRPWTTETVHLTKAQAAAVKAVEAKMLEEFERVEQ